MRRAHEGILREVRTVMCEAGRRESTHEGPNKVAETEENLGRQNYLLDPWI